MFCLPHSPLHSVLGRFPDWKFLRRFSSNRERSAHLSAEEHSVAACVVTDAEHFTQVIDGMRPGAVVELVRTYFSALVAPVAAYGGHLIDENGDGILAVWIGPWSPAELRRRVCSAAIEMAAATDRFNAQHPQHRLPTRLGIEVGHIAIADLGKCACLMRRAVGAPVITATRLEQLNKRLGTRILVSATVAEGERHHAFRDVGPFRLRGRRSDLRVLELLGRHRDIDPGKLELRDAFARGLARFEAGDLRSAECEFRSLLQRYPEDGVTRYYLNVCSTEPTSNEALPLLSVHSACI